MGIVDALMKTGLTRHESELYLALCREGEVTGYELAKITGIPRANVYQALSALADKGGARIIEGNPQRFTVVLPEEYCAIKEREMKDIHRLILTEAPTRTEAPGGYFTLSGHANILGKMRYIIAHATQRIYLAINGQDLPLIREEVDAAIQRGLKVVLLTSEGVEVPGATLHPFGRKQGQIRLIADSAEVLTGELSGSEHDVCLYSKNQPLIDLIKESLKNEIALSERK